MLSFRLNARDLTAIKKASKKCESVQVPAAGYHVSPNFSIDFLQLSVWSTLLCVSRLLFHHLFLFKVLQAASSVSLCITFSVCVCVFMC